MHGSPVLKRSIVGANRRGLHFHPPRFKRRGEVLTREQNVDKFSHKKAKQALPLSEKRP